MAHKCITTLLVCPQNQSLSEEDHVMQVTHDISNLTSAAFLNGIGSKVNSLFKVSYRRYCISNAECTHCDFGDTTMLLHADGHCSSLLIGDSWERFSRRTAGCEGFCCKVLHTGGQLGLGGQQHPGEFLHSCFDTSGFGSLKGSK